jgi:phosphoenolpyruvate synthase/pyruvate phosphate dikinase
LGDLGATTDFTDSHGKSERRPEIIVANGVIKIKGRSPDIKEGVVRIKFDFQKYLLPDRGG